MNNDPDIAAAFTRLAASKSLSKVDLSQAEFEMACESPLIYQKWGGFTWKQRRFLRQIALKLGVDLRA